MGHGAGLSRVVVWGGKDEAGKDLPVRGSWGTLRWSHVENVGDSDCRRKDRTHCMLSWSVALGGAWWRIRRHGTGRTDGSSESESQEGKPSLASEVEDKYQRNLGESPFIQVMAKRSPHQVDCPYNSILISTKTVSLPSRLTSSCLPMSCLLA